MMRRLFMIFVVGIFVFGFCSCDNNEIDSLATVMAVGIDVSDNQRRYTFALADTGGVSDRRNGDGAGVVCIYTDADDLVCAIEKADLKTGKKLSFSHLSAIIFSKKAIEQNVIVDVEWFLQKTAVRPQTLLAVSDAAPQEYLLTLNLSPESNPERHFEKTLRKKDAYVPVCSISDFVTGYHTGATSIIPVVFSEQSGEQKVSGSVLAYKGKSVAVLEDNGVLGILLSTKDVMLGENILKNAKKPRVEISVSDGVPKADVFLCLMCESDTDINALEKDAENMLTRYADNMCDIINITTLVRKNFRLWKDYEKFQREELIRKTVFDVKIKRTEANEYD